MNCDQCEKDTDSFKLYRNGRTKHNDTLFTVRSRAMTVCQSCLDKYGIRSSEEVTNELHT